MLILNNDDVKDVITMEVTIDALEESYRQLISREAVCRPRIDIRIPTEDPNKAYVWGTMEGGSATSGYFAIRMKSDIMSRLDYEGVITQEKYCVRPGLYFGLILLIDIHNGEPLAFLHDGYLQHMRVGADSGIGVRYMAREDAQVVGMLGSGGMARSHAEAFCLVRNIRRFQVYSPTREHREEFAREVSAKFGVEAGAMDDPREVYRGADILAACTDSLEPVVKGEWLEEGTHVISIGGGLDEEAQRRIDVSLRLGSAPAPRGLPDFGVHDEVISYDAQPPGHEAQWPGSMSQGRARGLVSEDRTVFLEAVLSGETVARPSPQAITYSARGNIQGAQFFAVAGKVYELARERGLGREIPTDWFLQDIRD